MNLLQKIFSNKRKEVSFRQPFDTNFYKLNTLFGAFSSIDLHKLERYYKKDVPPLYSVLQKDAGMFANAVIKHLSASGDDLGNTELIYALKRPHKMISGRSLLSEIRKNCNLYGFFAAYIEKKGSRGNISSITPLNPAETTIVTKSNSIHETEIKYINTTINGMTTTIDGIFLDNVFIFSPNAPKLKYGHIEYNSPFSAYVDVFEATKGIWETSNVLNNKRGALYAMSPKEGNLSLPKSPTLENSLNTGKEQVYDSYQSRFGTNKNQNQLLVLDSAYDFQALTPLIKDMQLTEQHKLIFDAICDAIGIDSVLFSGNQARYDNAKIAEKLHYDSNIIPFSEMFAQSFSRFLFGNINNTLSLDYSHLDVFQEDQKKNREVLKLETETIMQLNDKVEAGTMQRDGAVKMLTLNGFTDEDADLMITKKINSNADTEAV